MLSQNVDLRDRQEKQEQRIIPDARSQPVISHTITKQYDDNRANSLFEPLKMKTRPVTHIKGRTAK